MSKIDELLEKKKAGTWKIPIHRDELLNKLIQFYKDNKGDKK